MKTLIITTGGTIEAQYDPVSGTPYNVPVPPTAEDTIIPTALEKLGLRDNVDIYPLSMQDSKKITIDHLDHIIHKIANEGYSQVVIVHGTDTMPLHARYLKRRVAEYGAEFGMDKKTIVFTGAMGPLRDEQGQLRDPETQTFLNDGWGNLQKALADVKTAGPGIFVEMGQGPWEADTISKHVELEEAPENDVAMVKHSGFVQDDPKRHRELSFS